MGLESWLQSLGIGGWLRELTRGALSSPGNVSKETMNNWDGWAPYLPQTTLEPQELNILGCVNAPACIRFNYMGNNLTAIDVTPGLGIYRNESMWCNYTSPNVSRSSNAPLALPPGVFLFCGDRA